MLRLLPQSKIPKQPSMLARFETTLRNRAARFGVDLTDKLVSPLLSYYELLLAWNPRLHLVSPCSPETFATRHVLESLVLLPHLKENARITDVGSGAGLPIIPCLVARFDLRAVLIESSKKKSVFLHEALKIINASDRATVIAERFENVTTAGADYVTCRALDRFPEMLRELIEWTPSGTILLIFAGEKLRKQIESYTASCSVFPVAESDRRFLVRLII
jgi:16S rRNA (guanine527-N7)-methyltransferase